MARGNDWLRLTEETNALDYLERAGSFIVDADQDNFAWKWVVLALHGALYGFAIAACKGTNENVGNTHYFAKGYESSKRGDGNETKKGKASYLR